MSPSPYFVNAQDVLPSDSANDLARRLAILRQWLYGDEPFSIRYRLAPSIILRSEAELLGVSSPRFALRAYLAENSFVNVRRRETLSRSVQRTFTGELGQRLVGHVTNSRFFADSLLRVPNDLRTEGWRVLTCRLSRAYGEPIDFEATPFVAHVRLGGGLCAQAGCFIALALTENAKVYGIAEITRLAFPSDRQIRIAGLKPDVMANVLSRIDGANAILQQEIGLNIDGRIQRIGTAVRSYLASRCAVIVLLSFSRMFGKHLANKRQAMIRPTGNRVEQSRSKIPLEDPSGQLRTLLRQKGDLHAVVLVGWNSHERKRLVLNDPATFPFITTDINRLIDARPYREPERDEADRPLRDSDLGPAFQCIPVTPRGVRVPLLGGARGESGDVQKSLGLLEVARHEQLGLNGVAGLRYAKDVYHEGEFRLCDYSLSDAVPNLDGVSAGPPADLGFWRDQAPTGFRDWCWVQYLDRGDHSGRTSDSIWFWDAAGDWSNGRDSASRLLQVVARPTTSASWQVIYRKP